MRQGEAGIPRNRRVQSLNGFVERSVIARFTQPETMHEFGISDGIFAMSRRRTDSRLRKCSVQTTRDLPGGFIDEIDQAVRFKITLLCEARTLQTRVHHFDRKQ